MTKGLTRLTGVKGRSPKMYSGGQDQGEGDGLSREGLFTHSLILYYPPFLHK